MTQEGPSLDPQHADLSTDETLYDIIAILRSALSLPTGPIPVDGQITAFLEKTYGIQCPAPYSLEMESLRVGANTNLGRGFLAFGQSAAHIGRFCAFGPQVGIITNSHETCFPNLQSRLQARIGAANPVATTQSVVVGHNVWIGARCTVLPGVNIGHGAVLGAASVVTRDIPDFAIAVGNPARVKRLRFDQRIVDGMAELAWWNWPHDRIRRNRPFFDTDLTTYEGDVADLVVE